MNGGRGSGHVGDAGERGRRSAEEYDPDDTDNRDRDRERAEADRERDGIRDHDRSRDRTAADDDGIRDRSRDRTAADGDGTALDDDRYRADGSGPDRDDAGTTSGDVAVDRRERTYRGISVRAATQYLEGLGGEPVAEPGESNETEAGNGDEEGIGDGGEAGTEPDDTATDEPTVVAGEGWRATLSADTVDVGPSLQLTEVTVVFEGDAAALDDLVEEFSRKALRAGG